jgi:hypothetical protein
MTGLSWMVHMLVRHVSFVTKLIIICNVAHWIIRHHKLIIHITSGPTRTKLLSMWIWCGWCVAWPNCTWTWVVANIDMLMFQAHFDPFVFRLTWCSPSHNDAKIPQNRAHEMANKCGPIQDLKNYILCLQNEYTLTSLNLDWKVGTKIFDLVDINWSLSDQYVDTTFIKATTPKKWA